MDARVAIRFDLSSIPQNTVVQRAELVFNAYQVSEGYQDPNAKISVHRISRAWDESSVTWQKATTGTSWALAGGDYVQTPIVTTGYLNSGVESFVVTTAIQEFVGNPLNNNGLLLRVSVSKIQKHGIRSSEYATVSMRPRLLVTTSSTALQPFAVLPQQRTLHGASAMTTLAGRSIASIAATSTVRLCNRTLTLPVHPGATNKE